MDVLVHSVRALALHTIRDVSVHVEGKGGGLVSEIFLHRFDIVADFQAVHGVGVTQVTVPSAGRLFPPLPPLSAAELNGSPVFPRGKGFSLFRRIAKQSPRNTQLPPKFSVIFGPVSRYG